MQRIPVSCYGVHDDFHIGWSNHRLQILYKDRYTLKIHTAIGRGTEVIIRLPPQ